MMFKKFQVNENHIENSDYVLINASRMNNEYVISVAKIPVAILLGYFSRASLTAAQANRIVDRNIEAIGRIVNSKHARNETVPNHTYVLITRQDLDSCGEKLGDAVADAEMVYCNPVTGIAS